MVNKINIGVIGIQGAVSEHINSTKLALKEISQPGEVFEVKYKDQIDNLDALIIPGGESTTISRILFKLGAHEAIKRKIAENNMPIMGTCAGCVILSEEILDEEKDVLLLKAMNMSVRRNAFGRQKESFEQKINILDFKESYNAVFIRAPIIEELKNNCNALAKFDDKIIMARQNNMLALSFHPELTNDLRIHKYFLDIIKKNSNFKKVF